MDLPLSKTSVPHPIRRDATVATAKLRYTVWLKWKAARSPDWLRTLESSSATAAEIVYTKLANHRTERRHFPLSQWHEQREL